MSYRIGAQGPQSASGAQGPTLQSGAYWGSQGPVSGKRSPFVRNSSTFNLTGNVALFLEYHTAAGQTFAVMVERALPANSDLLSQLPDDLVQMVNLIDYRPQQGVFYTQAGGASTPFHIVETTDNTLLTQLKGTIKASDTLSPRYIQTEIGL